MKTNTLLIIAILAFALTSCGGDDSTAESSTVSTEAKSADNEPAAGANTIESLPWTFLVNGIYHNNVTIAAGSTPKSNANEGHWIDFKENGKFSYGIWDQEEYTGSWFYDGDTNILELTPKGTHKASEWRVMHKDDNLIWMGTSKYGDNAIQMQWLRREGYPTK